MKEGQRLSTVLLRILYQLTTLNIIFAHPNNAIQRGILNETPHTIPLAKLPSSW